MYLKKVEIHGFKSFADRITLKFEPGITGIIGPNGCGKSNVIDAIRWCLGEQGAKSLRSQHMLDVVFNGTQKRPAVGMAEVTLTFDNSKNVLPLDYNEVSISRRIFRSGESEYYLNKVQCRLKDIKDLFLDTGIGTEGYSVMEQGRVEFILNSKPEDRRSLFEEAAGVTKYKVRKDESLRKLEKISFDLVRLNDSLSLIKDQLKALDAQARKARNFQNLKEELKTLEIIELLNAYKAAQGEVSSLESLLVVSRDKLQGCISSVDSAEASVEEMRLHLHSKDEEYIKVQGESMRFRAELDSLENRISQSKNAQVELEQKISNLKIEIENDRLEIDKLALQKSTIYEEYNVLEVEFEGAVKNLSEAEKSFTSLNTSVELEERRYAELKTLMDDSESGILAVNNEIAQIRSYLAHNEAQSHSRNRELQKIEEKYTPQIKEIDDLKVRFGTESENIKEYENISTALAGRIKFLRENIDAGRSHISELEKEISGISAKIEAFNEMQKGDIYISGTKAVLAANFNGITGPIYKILETNPEGEKVLSHYLGDKLNYLVAATYDDARIAVDFLRENNLGRANFIVLENLPQNANLPTAEAGEVRSLIKHGPQYGPLVNFILSGAVVSENHNISNGCFVQGGSFIEGTLSYFSRMKDSDNFQSRKRELEELLLEAKTSLEAQLNELERNIGEYELKFEMFNQKKVEFSLIEKQMASKEQEVQLLMQEKTVINAELSRVYDEGSRLNEELNTHIRNREVLQSELSARKTSFDELTLKLDALQSDQKVLNDLLTDAKVGYSSILERKIAKEKEKEYIDTQLSNYQSFRNRKAEELDISLKEVKNLEVVREESLASSRVLIVKVEEVEKSAALIRDERDEINERIRAQMEALQTSKMELAAVQEAVHKLELKLNHNLDEQKNTIKALTQNHSISIEEAQGRYELKEVAEEEKLKLQKRIEMMGAVNLAAPEEYQELTQRHDFLNTQMADIVKAKEDLMEVISKINNITKTNFKDTFDKVRENFKFIFKQLFKGGEADLIMTNEANLLETGIDIIAQPPGKKLANIMSLSGGEKALSAIAFLFAFYMVRPSPFCILDEVDAPLDEANVGRFNELIKGFTHQSQFLMITHSKRTMEIADALYGVTMEEFGVSKLVSVIISKEKPKVEVKTEPGIEESDEKGELVEA